MSTRGTKGYYIQNGKYYAQITISGKHMRLGVYSTAEEAYSVYKAKKAEIGVTYTKSTKTKGPPPRK